MLSRLACIGDPRIDAIHTLAAGDSESGRQVRRLQSRDDQGRDKWRSRTRSLRSPAKGAIEASRSNALPCTTTRGHHQHVAGCGLGNSAHAIKLQSRQALATHFWNDAKVHCYC